MDVGRFSSLLFWQIVCVSMSLLFVASSEAPSKYEIVVPHHLHPSRLRRDLSTSTQNGHLERTSYSIEGKGRSFVLDLYLNKHLLHKGYFGAYQLPNGKFVVDKEVEHCYYHGILVGKLNTSVVLSTCSGLSGTIQDEDGKIFGIQPKEMGSMEHLLYDMEDYPKTDAKCGVDGKSLDLNLPSNFASHFRVRRATSSLVNQKKYVALAIVNDKRQFEKNQKNITLVVRKALEVANYVDQLYKTLNTRVAVVYVETWNVVNLANVTSSGAETYGHFKGYDKVPLAMKLFKMKIRRDNSQLIAGDKFSGGVVGMAGVGNICGINSCGVNADRGHPSVTAATMAHEMGHNLGMGHDGGGCRCSKGPCVMSAYSSGASNSFSTCSKAALDERVTDGLASCLFDVPEKLFSKPVCGNDFLEDGEECDCGTLLECNTTGGAACCNATTCTLHGHAKCAVGPCCSGCQFIKQGVTCRSPQTECDLEEACTGKSAECPGNFYRQDGTPCLNDTAYCFEGGCRTHLEQCEYLWGKGTQIGEDVCFSENTAGNRWSNCGKDDKGHYKRCKSEDVKCGTVQCSKTANRFPIPGDNKGAKTVWHYVWVNGKQIAISCRMGITDLGADLDNPTLTPQGTKCADGKICIDHKCQQLASLDFIKKCPNNNTCANGGLCNNLGNCHCPVGFACPDCKNFGEGGSMDSGNVCARNGGYSSWGSFTACSKTCDGGIKTRTRNCSNPAPNVYGLNCSRLGADVEVKSCNNNITCPVFSDWGNFTQCSESCGGGTKTRKRTCTYPPWLPTGYERNCSHLGADVEVKPCNEQQCPDRGMSAMTKSMLILFVGILPVVFLAIFLLFRFRSKLPCHALQRAPTHDPKPGSSRLEDKSHPVPNIQFKKLSEKLSYSTSPPDANENSYTNKAFMKEAEAAPQVPRLAIKRPAPLPPVGRQPAKPVLSDNDPPPPYPNTHVTPSKDVKPPSKEVKPHVGGPLSPLRPVNAAGRPRPPPKLPPVPPKKQ